MRWILALALIAACAAPASDDDDSAVAEATPTPEPTPVDPWHPGPYGTAVYEVVGDFTVPTSNGDWNFREHWTGDDTYTFLHRVNSDYSRLLWDTSFEEMLGESDDNQHYFFVSGRSTYEDDAATVQANIDATLATMDTEAAKSWGDRLHVVTARASDLDDQLFDMLDGQFAISIDRFQRRREVGLMQFVCDGCSGDPWFLAHPGRYFNFEHDRQVWLDDNVPDEEIVLWDEFQMQGDRADLVIDLDRARDYDTLEVDLTMGCVDHLDSNCFEWDYKARMDICKAPVEPEPKVPGSCDPGELDDAGVEIRPPETASCECTAAYEGVTEQVRTCNRLTDEEGNITGGEWGACACNCDYQIARWITPYHREGRWVTDISPMLGLMQEGGPTRIFIDLDYPFLVSASLRFSNRKKESKPFAFQRLWGGGGFGSGYNDAHEPITFTPPEGTTGVKLHALITGHGFNGDPQNCSEFCPHAHSFKLNDGDWFTREFDEARNFLGCALQVDDGALPNQFGTWYLGRGGWCPGMDVPPVVFDLSESLVLGEENTVRYTARLNGQEPSNHGSIWMDSYLVFYR